jgi:hypothetical protein
LDLAREGAVSGSPSRKASLSAVAAELSAEGSGLSVTNGENTMTTATSHPEVQTKRDYSLVGQSTRSAIESGLTSAEWYQTPVPRQTLKELMKRSDTPAIRDTVIWLGTMTVALAGGVWFWGTW